jgi:predicted murein hydrolase (TIGR00659 family)
MTLSSFTDNPLFGFTLTVGMMMLYTRLFRGSKSMLLNPFLFSVFTIIALLLFGGIPYEHYEKGASILSFFMGPAIVALAVPLYKQFDRLKANALPVLVGITTGVVVSIASGVALSSLMGLTREMTVSMAPKGATSAISMNMASMMGGDPAMTVTFVNIAGIIGNMFGVKAYELFGITHPTAQGIGLGTAAHAIGTKRALELGEEQGAMSSLSIGLAGILTAFLMPVLLRLFGLL